jgi:hypothetical protein
MAGLYVLFPYFNHLFLSLLLYRKTSLLHHVLCCVVLSSLTVMCCLLLPAVRERLPIIGETLSRPTNSWCNHKPHRHNTGTYGLRGTRIQVGKIRHTIYKPRHLDLDETRQEMTKTRYNTSRYNIRQHHTAEKIIMFLGWEELL